MNLQARLLPSRLLAVALTLGHALALLAVWSLPFPDWAYFALMVLILLDWAWMLWSHAGLRVADAWVAIQISGESWTLTRRDGGQVEAKVLRDGLVTPWVCVLVLALEENRSPLRIVVMRDSMDPDAFRNLRVLLRWGMVS